MGGSEIWLEVGEKMSVDDLLKAIIIQSANDATVALAEYTAGSEEEFLKQMNEHAAKLGMNDTYYLNTTGFDEEGQYTCAYDIALVARELMKYPLVFNYTTIWMDELRDGKTMLTNTNKLLKTYSGITGLKTGTTDDAGNCFCGTAQRDGMNLISVVLGSETSEERFSASRALLDYGFARWSVCKLPRDDIQIPNVKVVGGMDTEICGELSVKEMTLLVPKGTADKVETKVIMNEDVGAPVEKGQTIGTVLVTLDGEELARITVLSQYSLGEITVKSAFAILWTAFLKK